MTGSTPQVAPDAIRVSPGAKMSQDRQNIQGVL